MRRPLIIEHEAISRVVDYAKDPSHWYYPDEDEPPGNNSNYVCVMSSRYRCVFSFTRLPDGLYRHLSVSLLAATSKATHPSPENIALLANAFGFTGTFSNTFPADWHIGFEGVSAVVVIQSAVL